MEWPGPLVGALLALLTLAVFLPLVRASFVNIDDGLYVTQNPYVIAGLRRESVVRAFTNVLAGHSTAAARGASRVGFVRGSRSHCGLGEKS